MKQRMRRWWFVMLGVCVLTLATILPRVAAFGNFPPAPYWEELALGYDAFSLLRTGADHHGHPWPVVAFESFGDWKPSGYFYAAVLPIAVFGLNVLSVRLPSIVAGVLLVPGIGLLAQRLLTRITMKTSLQEPVALDPFVQKMIPWVVMAVAALNPWLIQFSRAAWEVNLATTLSTKRQKW
jgi:4-amino-4-deoxy-L-arabinose transferase-like glycosyltransferase